jgi:methyl-accepting chemotaxis protein
LGQVIDSGAIGKGAIGKGAIGKGAIGNGAMRADLLRAGARETGTRETGTRATGQVRGAQPSRRWSLGRLFRGSEARLGLVAEVATSAGALGLEVVDVAGDVDMLSNQWTEQAGLFTKLRDDAEQMRRANRETTMSAAAARAATHEATALVRESQSALQSSLAGMEDLASWVESVGGQMQELVRAVENIGHITNQVEKIAASTRMLALNATIEAARTGEAGRGFTIIASSIRDLAQQTIEAAGAIGSTIGALTVQIHAVAEDGSQATHRARGAEADARSIGESIGSVSDAALVIDSQVSSIADAAQTSARLVDDLVGTMSNVVSGVERSAAGLGTAGRRMNKLLVQVEDLIGLTARSGMETVDSPFVRFATQVAQETQALLIGALQSGRISESELFDDRYEPVPGTDPEQYLTRFTRFMEQLLADRFEQLLSFDPRMVFVVVTDRNGYVPVHHKAFSQPQRRNPAWNLQHCRNRRIFDDRTGLSAARNTQPFLLQAYRRDLGEGKHALLKDLSVPIYVFGRHWGALRIAYEATSKRDQQLDVHQGHQRQSKDPTG